MKRTDKPIAGQKVYVCYKDKYQEAIYQYEDLNAGYHGVRNPYDISRVEPVHRLQIRLTPPKIVKKPVKFNVGDDVVIKCKIASSPEEHKSLIKIVPLNSLCSDYFLWFYLDGKTNPNDILPSLFKVKKREK